LDVAAFLDAMYRCCRQLVESQEEFPQAELIADLIPEIHLEPPPKTVPAPGGT
jgi:hypothetical protein